MQKFLTLKHWQLFSLVGVPYILGAIVAFVSVRYASNRLLSTALNVLWIALFSFCIVVAIGWFYTVTKKLHERLPASVGMSLLKFKIFLIMPLLCAIFAVVADTTLFGILPLFILFSIYCFFYCIYFCAKALAAVEIQKNPSPNDWVGAFMQIYFWPLGVWGLQPRINKIFSAS